MSVGYVYIFDYITDAGDDMNLQDLDGKVAGTDYCVGPPQASNSPNKLDIEIERFYGGGGYGMRYDMIEEPITLELKCSFTERDNILDYFARHKDNKTSADYISWRFGSGVNDFVKAYDKDAVKMEYCRGFLTDVSPIWTDSESNLWTVRIKFEVVWSV